MKKSIFLSVVIVFACAISAFSQGASGYKVVKTFHIASSGGWDYIAADPMSNKLYVSHGTQVNILNKVTGDSLGVIPNTTGVHGIAFVHAIGRGYTSNGRLNDVTVFDLKTGAVTGQIATGQNPDAIMYDDYSKMVITCNGRSNDLSVIDPVKGEVVTTIPVGGKPETAVSDGEGKIYVNIEDKSEIAVVDIKTKEVKARWSIAPGEGPTGLAIDRKTHRLFAGCDKMLIVVNAETGAIVANVAIGDGCDGVGFDADRKLVFASCGEGVLSVVEEASADKFNLLDNVPTKRGARTVTVDAATHAIYLPTADFGAAPASGGRPPMVPGSFQVLMVQK
ncbi:MAG TPA: hypothetical protein VG738_15560 [Chitinophagaceae bacterium]|nr:hypothetical protein [Chitinophagaceae bacterium]